MMIMFQKHSWLIYSLLGFCVLIFAVVWFLLGSITGITALGLLDDEESNVADEAAAIVPAAVIIPVVPDRSQRTPFTVDSAGLIATVPLTTTQATPEAAATPQAEAVAPEAPVLPSTSADAATTPAVVPTAASSAGGLLEGFTDRFSGDPRAALSDLQGRGTVGQVASLGESSFTVTSMDGSTVTVYVDGATQFRTRGNQAVSWTDITVGARVLVMGDPIDGHADQIQAQIIGVMMR
jgi:hypothetical protein